MLSKKICAHPAEAVVVDRVDNTSKMQATIRTFEMANKDMSSMASVTMDTTTQPTNAVLNRVSKKICKICRKHRRTQLN